MRSLITPMELKGCDNMILEYAIASRSFNKWEFFLKDEENGTKFKMQFFDPEVARIPLVTGEKLSPILECPDMEENVLSQESISSSKFSCFLFQIGAYKDLYYILYGKQG